MSIVTIPFKVGFSTATLNITTYSLAVEIKICFYSHVILISTAMAVETDFDGCRNQNHVAVEIKSGCRISNWL